MAYPMPLETTGDFNHPPSLSGPPTGAPGASTVFSASDHFNDARPHLLLCASGSVATIKIPLIVQRLTTAYKPMPHIRIILTASSAHFLSGQSVEQPPVPSLTSLPGVEAVYADEDEWAVPWTRGSKILHIELRRWADACAVAPLSANSMAKMVQGIADNLLLSTLRAWDTDGTVDPIRWPPSMQRMPPGSAPPKKILVAPAMNTAMWRHPVTRVQVRMLEEEWGTWVRVLRPQEKELACGDTGDGAMRDWRQVVAEIADVLGLEEKGSNGFVSESESVFRKEIGQNSTSANFFSGSGATTPNTLNARDLSSASTKQSSDSGDENGVGDSPHSIERTMMRRVQELEKRERADRKPPRLLEC